MVPAYVLLTVMRSHSVEYLNGIFAVSYTHLDRGCFVFWFPAWRQLSDGADAVGISVSDPLRSAPFGRSWGQPCQRLSLIHI